MCRRTLAAVCVLLLVACGGASSQAPPPGVRVVATEFHFEPSALTLTAGVPVTLTFKNAGQTLHDFTIVSGPGSDKPPDHIAADPGKEATLTLNLPAGSYTFICSVLGHKELGMQGTIAVQ
jgi:uncharacterized cupredoxin-like copper-binding protein